MGSNSRWRSRGSSTESMSQRELRHRTGMTSEQRRGEELRGREREGEREREREREREKGEKKRVTWRGERGDEERR